MISDWNWMEIKWVRGGIKFYSVKRDQNLLLEEEDYMIYIRKYNFF
jgi:hypothetical protein